MSRVLANLLLLQRFVYTHQATDLFADVREVKGSYMYSVYKAGKFKYSKRGNNS